MYIEYKRIDKKTVTYYTEKGQEIIYSINNDAKDIDLLSIAMLENYLPHCQRELWKLYEAKKNIIKQKKSLTDKYALYREINNKINRTIYEINFLHKINIDKKNRINFTEIKRIDKRKVRKI